MPESSHRDLPLGRATARELADAYTESLAAFSDLANSLDQTEWSLPSPCPGWTVADVISHVSALELELHGEPLPDHEPDWDSLPHVETPVDKYVERQIDLRRGWTQAEILAELREVVAWRADDLASPGANLEAPVQGPGGWELTLGRYLRVRVFDIWVHEQDIRAAIGTLEDLSGDGAWITAGELLSAMPRVWGKSVGAPVGSSLRLRVDGPGVEFERVITVGDDGRARWDDAAGPAEADATVAVTMSWPAFLARATGRAAYAGSGDGVVVTGDQGLGSAFLDRMTVTF